jgi:hypothetical protein
MYGQSSPDNLVEGNLSSPTWLDKGKDVEKENSGGTQLDAQSSVFKKRVEKTADILFDTATVAIYFFKL